MTKKILPLFIILMCMACQTVQERPCDRQQQAQQDKYPGQAGTCEDRTHVQRLPVHSGIPR